MKQLQEKSEDDPWYVYIVRCHDNTLYTGITKDVNKRVLEHNSGPKGARYTRSRRPVSLVYCEHAVSRSAAASREHRIRKLKTTHKQRLLSQPEFSPAANPAPDNQRGE